MSVRRVSGKPAEPFEADIQKAAEHRTGIPKNNRGRSSDLRSTRCGLFDSSWICLEKPLQTPLEPCIISLCGRSIAERFFSTILTGMTFRLDSQVSCPVAKLSALHGRLCRITFTCY
jgi:hypothetical protein